MSNRQQKEISVEQLFYYSLTVILQLYRAVIKGRNP